MENFDNILQKAKEASKSSYSPYSGFPVGAAILYENGSVFTGCNVENASYGLSLCAERNAMSTAISNNEGSRIKAIAVYSPCQPLCMPCGACRQWISEFCISEKETKIVLEDNDKKTLVLNLGDIFPYGFKLDSKN